MKQIDQIRRRKRILLVDVPDVYKSFSPLIHRWGYQVIATYSNSADSISEMILREQVDLLIVAMELTLKGPSLSADWKSSDGLDADMFFGHKVVIELRRQKIKLPVIFLTTNDLERNKWLYDDDNNLDCVIMMKNNRGNIEASDELKKATGDFLGRGLEFHEWMRVLIVSNEFETCRAIENVFKGADFLVHSVNSASDAIRKLEQDFCDLLLVHVEKGNEMLGIETIKSLREKPERPRVMVISDLPEDEIKMYLQGEGIGSLVDRYLSKKRYSVPQKLIDDVTYDMEQYSV